MEPRNGILAAAQTVFARHGFRQTTMAMVAAQADLTRQALYHHFDSKEALFAALVDDIHVSALTAAREAAAQGAVGARDPDDLISRILLAHHRSFVESVAGSPFAAELIEEGSKLCGAAVVAHAQRFEKDLEAVVAGLVRARRLLLKPGLSAREFTEMVCAAAKGVKMANAGAGEARYAQALKRMVETICAGAVGASAKTEQRMGTARRVAR